jgi:hypothetical protein
MFMRPLAVSFDPDDANAAVAHAARDGAPFTITVIRLRRSR